MPHATVQAAFVKLPGRPQQLMGVFEKVYPTMSTMDWRICKNILGEEMAIPVQYITPLES